MSRATVVVTEALDATCADWMAQHVTVVRHGHDQPGLDAVLARAQGLIVRTYTQVNAALLDRSPQLRVVGRAGVGLDNIDLDACQARDIRVVYTPDANTQAVVEYVLAVMLDHVRPRTRMADRIAAQDFHAMRKSEVGRQLDQMTLGIVGFGRIGKRIGQVAHALGMRLLVNDILPEAGLRGSVNYPYDFVDKPTLYRKSDIVTLHVDGRARNRHMLDADALSLLRDDCLLINAARGMLVDAPALAQWASRVAPAGGKAVLDVHDPEPPVDDYPLYGLPNVLLLPHIASRTTAALQNMSWVVRDVVAVLQGRDPVHPADAASDTMS